VFLHGSFDFRLVKLGYEAVQGCNVRKVMIKPCCVPRARLVRMDAGSRPRSVPLPEVEADDSDEVAGVRV
jgi:hypothetical protein